MRPAPFDPNDRNLAMYEAILRLDNLEDCLRFFDDLCAVTELHTMELRRGRLPFARQGLQRDPPRNRRIQRHGQPRKPYAELRHRQAR